MSDNKLKTYVSPNKAIMSALSPILPIAHLQYSGTAETYAIFRIVNRNVSVIGSGRNKVVDCYILIDVFSPDDLSRSDSVVGDIENALLEAGFIVRDIADVNFSPDGSPQAYHHTEIDCVLTMEVAA
jgi:hypothetical protein